MHAYLKRRKRTKKTVNLQIKKTKKTTQNKKTITKKK